MAKETGNEKPKEQDFWQNFHFNIAPPLFVIVFTFSVQILAVLGSTDPNITWSLIGNTYSWTLVGIMMFWAFASLKVPGKEFKGPTTLQGFTPVYKANGLQYFFISMFSFVFLLFVRPQTALDITNNFPQILASCNLTAFVLCLFLLYKGKTDPSEEEPLGEFPIVYEFYRGMEIHPVLMGVDVKQLTNCRFGLMAWLLLVINFTVSSWLNHGFSVATFVCVTLQTIYLAKFYWWETGYFNTLDITLDRAGYYICWGCLVWVPAFYTFSAYFLATREPLINPNLAWIVFFFGVISTILNYWVDYQKEYFRNINSRQCRLWLSPVKSIKASYKTPKGVKQTQLLTSGFWGVARHLNYVFEIFIALSWSLPCSGYGIWPFMYPIFITVLLVHRVFRDEKKCSEKYGSAWETYCQQVPYRMIPGIF